MTDGQREGVFAAATRAVNKSEIDRELERDYARNGGRFSRRQSMTVKSELYVDLLPLLNSGRITLPRNERLVAQIVSLERTVTRGSGKENIDHPRTCTTTPRPRSQAPQLSR